MIVGSKFVMHYPSLFSDDAPSMKLLTLAYVGSFVLGLMLGAVLYIVSNGGTLYLSPLNLPPKAKCPTLELVVPTLLWLTTLHTQEPTRHGKQSTNFACNHSYLFIFCERTMVGSLRCTWEHTTPPAVLVAIAFANQQAQNRNIGFQGILVPSDCVLSCRFTFCYPWIGNKWVVVKSQ
jgi:hypothetical protein